MTMQNAPAPQPRVQIPSIVLLVDDHRDTLERYTSYLEQAGLWVATSAVASEAVAAAEDLSPDLVILDADSTGADPAALLQELHAPGRVRSIPVILLTSGGDAPAADAVLVKPVQPGALLRCAKDLLARARRARSTSDQVISRGRALIQRSAELLAKRAEFRIEARPHLCPECGGTLDWVEQGTIEGTTYDYYRWCPKGCGLYCFDVSAAEWVKLA